MDCKDLDIEDLDHSFSGIVSRYQDDKIKALQHLEMMLNRAIDLDHAINELDKSRSALRGRKSVMIGGIKNMAEHLKISIPFSMKIGGLLITVDKELDFDIIPIINA